MRSQNGYEWTIVAWWTSLPAALSALMNPRLLAHAEVVLAVRRRDVDDADAVVGGDVVVVQDAERALGLLVGEVREDRLVLPALHLGALQLAHDLVLLRLLEDVRKPRLRHHVHRPRVVGQVADDHVVDVRADAHREVLGQRPRRRSPDEEVDGPFQAVEFPKRIKKPSPHRDRRILDVLVVRARLEVG